MTNINTRPATYIVYVLVNGDLHRIFDCETTHDVVASLAHYLHMKEAASNTEYYSCVVYKTVLVSPAFRNALLREAEHYV